MLATAQSWAWCPAGGARPVGVEGKGFAVEHRVRGHSVRGDQTRFIEAAVEFPGLARASPMPPSGASCVLGRLCRPCLPKCVCGSRPLDLSRVEPSFSSQVCPCIINVSSKIDEASVSAQQTPYMPRPLFGALLSRVAKRRAAVFVVRCPMASVVPSSVWLSAGPLGGTSKPVPLGQRGVGGGVLGVALIGLRRVRSFGPFHCNFEFGS